LVGVGELGMPLLLPLDADPAAPPVPLQRSEHLLDRDVTVAQRYKLPAVAPAPRVLDVRLERASADQPPRLLDRLAHPERVVAVPQRADPLARHAREHVGDSSAGGHRIVRLEHDLDTTLLGL